MTVVNYATEATIAAKAVTTTNELGFVTVAIEVRDCKHIVCIRNMVLIHSQSWPLIGSSNVCVKLVQSETLKMN